MLSKCLAMLSLLEDCCELRSINLYYFKSDIKNEHEAIISWMLIWSWSLLKLLVTLLIDVMIWVFDQNPSDLKVEFSKDKRNIEKEKKHMRILSRENYFWTRNWPGLVNGKRYDTKVCYEGITNNGDEWESKCPDRLLAYNKAVKLFTKKFGFIKTLRITKNWY